MVIQWIRGHVDITYNNSLAEFFKSIVLSKIIFTMNDSLFTKTASFSCFYSFKYITKSRIYIANSEFKNSSKSLNLKTFNFFYIFVLKYCKLIDWDRLHIAGNLSDLK